ncbi:prevent-host-death family protein, putative [Synechococcus sp. PCC 7335]|nr:prevent-host-death family protein, putative [Synechococcus sp. PCC 7335]
MTTVTLMQAKILEKFAMKAISKSKLKSKLLEFLRFVESEGEELVVTDRGNPVVKIVKYAESPSTEALFGDMRGKVQYFEDLTAPTSDEWEEL